MSDFEDEEGVDEPVLDDDEEEEEEEVEVRFWMRNIIKYFTSFYPLRVNFPKYFFDLARFHFVKVVP